MSEQRLHAGYLISTDATKLDREAIWLFLRDSYWARGITPEVVDASIDNALCFGLYDPAGRQAGFARVVTDRVRIGWLSDLFVLPEHRGHGLGTWLIETVLAHPEIARTRLMLKTSDAHELYRRFGFEPVDGTRLMQREPARK